MGSIENQNKLGPKSDPWGIPYFKGARGSNSLWMETHNFKLNRYEDENFRSIPDISPGASVCPTGCCDRLCQMQSCGPEEWGLSTSCRQQPLNDHWSLKEGQSQCYNTCGSQTKFFRRRKLVCLHFPWCKTKGYYCLHIMLLFIYYYLTDCTKSARFRGWLIKWVLALVCGRKLIDEVRDSKCEQVVLSNCQLSDCSNNHKWHIF